jgi:serine/threonine protein kinase
VWRQAIWRWFSPWPLEDMVSDEVNAAGRGLAGESAITFGPGSWVAGYRLEQRIGKGGMAVVYRARDERLDRWVALKVLTPALALDHSFRQRFVRESRAAAAVDDPHIIPIYEAGEADGALYIAMRYVRGGDVGSLVRRSGPLAPARVAAIISAVASALDAAHAAGLVHRDVKPANMLLERQADRPDHVYLSDFGLSKAGRGAASLTGDGLFMGTLDYSAPEQIRGRPIDGRADQYALACAAFELLAGEPPFRREEPLAVMYAQVNAPPPSLAARRAGLPARVDQVLARALAKSPGERYDSCGQLAADLARALGLLPTRGDAAEATLPPRRAVPSPPSWPSPQAVTTRATDGRGLARRRSRARVLATALVAGVLVAGGVSAAIALSGGPRPSAPRADRTQGRAGPTHSPSARPGATGQIPGAVPFYSIRVCTSPFLPRCTASDMKAEPTLIATIMDGTELLKNLTWTGWAQATTRATGRLGLDNCQPDCAQGTYTWYPATVTLTGLTPYGNGLEAYADMSVTSPTSPYHPGPFTRGLVP